MNSADTTREARAVQMDLYRRMSPARKFELICKAYRFGQTLAMGGIRMRYPDAAEEQIQGIWAREHLGEDLYSKAYGNGVNRRVDEGADGLRIDTSPRQ
jgi:hypothetical protein